MIDENGKEKYYITQGWRDNVILGSLVFWLVLSFIALKIFGIDPYVVSYLDMNLYNISLWIICEIYVIYLMLSRAENIRIKISLKRNNIFKIIKVEIKENIK